ncbi:unnamed protein product, partial [marine sediment metagenome]
MPRPEIMHNFLGNKGNLGLCFIRRSRGQVVSNFFVSKHITDKTILSSLDNANIAPLYIYPNIDSDAHKKSFLDTTHWPPDVKKCGRVPNLNPEFVQEMEQKLGMTFTTENVGDLQSTFGPENIFTYIYAVLHSPTYRERYSELLKIDFPRLPLTSNIDLFRDLCVLGADLVALHLMEDNYEAASWNQGRDISPYLHLITHFTGGNNGTTIGSFSKSKCYEEGRVYIDTSLGKSGSY